MFTVMILMNNNVQHKKGGENCLSSLQEHLSGLLIAHTYSYFLLLLNHVIRYGWMK